MPINLQINPNHLTREGSPKWGLHTGSVRQCADSRIPAAPAINETQEADDRLTMRNGGALIAPVQNSEAASVYHSIKTPLRPLSLPVARTRSKWWVVIR
jgi:hypothetical protein